MLGTTKYYCNSRPFLVNSATAVHYIITYPQPSFETDEPKYLL